MDRQHETISDFHVGNTSSLITQELYLKITVSVIPIEI